MSTWLMVRSTADLDSACDHVNALFSRLWQQENGAANNELHGIWIDPTLATHPPARLSTWDTCGQETRCKIRETVGLAGVWQLCWIEADKPERELTRYDIVNALQAASSENAAQTPLKCLIPVFSTITWHAEIRAELRRLSLAKSYCLLPPWLQDSTLGRCIAFVSDEWAPMETKH